MSDEIFEEDELNFSHFIVSLGFFHYPYLHYYFKLFTLCTKQFHKSSLNCFDFVFNFFEFYSI